MNWEPWTGCYKVSDGCTNKQSGIAKELGINILDFANSEDNGGNLTKGDI